MISPGFGLANARAALIAGLCLALPAAAAAQPAAKPAQAQGSDKADALKQRDEELKALREQQQKSTETEAEIKRQIEEIGNDRRKLNQALIDSAAKLRDVEAKVSETETRLKPLDAQEATLRSSLESRRSVIGEVLAALQRIGRRPPPALIASPEDALQAVRTAMVLGAVLPEMRDQVADLARDLSGLLAVRKKIDDERDTLKKQLASLGDERTRMSALVGERQKQEAEREKALAAERTRAADLAKQAGTLKDLIAKLEQGLDPATRAAREAARGEPRPLSTLKDPGRMAPAVAFASLRGRVPIPVNGVKLKVFGDSDGTGGTEKGVSIATRAGAQITAPADGWVVYAGPFRSYGQLLILNVGGGYHVLLAGMDRISVDLGQFVLTGEPVAVMGNGSQIAAVLATGSSQPVLYVELRKDGTPVDPGPWWASGEGEKVRG
ncbi:MAG TPA: peptidoglycan DD-metalloendopeptidase family protein [Pseudolabrys sp.]|jgi:septal ring factor EnvC (AmiA/AmiB activator)|nr:peptidoglycan DD-metalloendopeptidase family protein [Pseudolabrys sp.]